MAEKNIFSIGFTFPGNTAEYLSFDSEQSLLDADIIVFNPDISNIYNTHSYYQGKKRLHDSCSFKLKENTSHWRRELLTAFNSGKTIFIFLNKLNDVFIYTGTNEYSGTGKNTRTTNIVTSYDNYKCIPLNLGKIIPAKGSKINPATDLKYLAHYWQEFSEYSNYEIYLDAEIGQPLLKTKTGNKIVSTVIYGNKANGEGNIFLLPKLTYNDKDFTKYKNEQSYWNDKGITFGTKLANCFIQIDKVLRSETEKSTAPDWVNDSSFRLKLESTYENQIEEISQQIESLEEKQREIKLELNKVGNTRRLLYENGNQLEEAILESLILMGFDAERYQDSDSEFDSVFKSDEGLFLGEAEGKDTKAIDVTKIRQLTTNIQEYYDKFDEFPKGILFGNAYRFTKPDERAEFFTTKCLAMAKQFNITLIRTTDLFKITQYLKENDDNDFKQLCRLKIFEANGTIVEFPEIPTKESNISKSKVKTRKTKETA